MNRCTLLTQTVTGVVLGFGLLYLVHASAAPVERAARPTAQSSPPHLAIFGERCDLGMVAGGGQQVRIRFHVLNRGDRRLILRRIDGGCDCAFAREGEITVQPGERKTIEAEIGPPGGSQGQNLELLYRTNDPTRPLLRVPCILRLTD